MRQGLILTFYIQLGISFMPYEQGMQIKYNPETKQVMVTFRGERIILPENYESSETASMAAEKYCRRQGWNP